MDFTITAISYGDDPAGWPAGGSPAVSNYLGDPLYWHVAKDSTAAGVIITIDQNAANSTDGATGPVSQIVFNYTTPSLGASTQQMVWNKPGVQVNADRLLLHLRLRGGEDDGDAVLGISKEPQFGGAAAAAGAEKPGSLGLVVLGPAVTGDGPRAYFVNIPVIHPAAAVTGRVRFPDPGSIGGPIGSINVP